MKKKNKLCGESFLNLSKMAFSRVPDHRTNPDIKLSDTLMSGLAVFKLKMPSLLQFENLKSDEPQLQNIKNIFSVEHVPSDTQLPLQ